MQTLLASIDQIEQKRKETEGEIDNTMKEITEKKRVKQENEENCRIVIKNMNQKQALYEEELMKLKSLIAEYEENFRKVVVLKESLKQEIETDKEELEGKKKRLESG